MFHSQYDDLEAQGHTGLWFETESADVISTPVTRLHVATARSLLRTGRKIANGCYDVLKDLVLKVAFDWVVIQKRASILGEDLRL